MKQETTVSDITNASTPDRARITEREPHPLVLLFVDHSHFDYAWYRRRTASQIREASLIDGIQNTLLSGNRATFTIEQSVAGREYREGLRRDKQKEFDDLCKEGRYEQIGAEIQQEIFLSGEEVFFWNVNVGQDFWKSIGGRPSQAFYQPDTFGVPRSFAKMLRHAGYDNFIYMRGHGDEIKSLGAVYNLTSDDGSSVLAIPMMDGYGSANKLGRSRMVDGVREYLKERPELWNAAAEDTLRSFLEKYGGRFTQIELPYVLLGSGSDFEDIDVEMPEIVAHCRQALQKDFPGIQMRFGTFDEYIRLIKETVVPANLQTYSGELRSSAEQPVLRSIESARMPLKQAANRAEREIYTADTLLALSMLKHKSDQTVFLEHDIPLLTTTMYDAKRIILPTYSHDAISGCGADDVYSDMFSRIEDATDFAQQVSRNSLANLAATKDIYMPVPLYGNEISIVNPLGSPRRKLIEVPLRDNLARAQALVAQTAEEIVPVQIVERDGRKFAALAIDVAGFSSKNVLLREAEKDKTEKIEEKKPPTIKNEFYKVDVLASGVVRVTDKASGKITFTNLFEDVGERGDEYNFCPIDGDIPVTTEGAKSKIKITEDGPVFSELQIELDMPLPEKITKDRKARSDQKVSTPIKTSIRLTSGVDRVDFITTLTNTARDHRLRLLFKTPGTQNTVRAKEPFEVIERPTVPILGGEDWKEPLPIATSHMQGMLAAGDVTVFTKGLQEYEAIPGEDGNIEEVAITLLRGVDRLSRDDLSTRKGPAGPMEDGDIDTPGAQCLGTHTFEYSLNMRGQESNSNLIKRLDDYRIDFQRGPKDVTLDNVLRVNGDVVISAVAPSRDGSGAIVRLYNPNSTTSSVNIEGMFETVQRCNAREAIESEDDARQTTVRPGEIITLKLT